MKSLIFVTLILTSCDEAPRPFGRSQPFEVSVEQIIEKQNPEKKEEIPLLDPRNRR